MTFHEKLRRLTEDRKKCAVARKAGLPASAIHNYLAKSQIPAADTALRLARALRVDVGWLIDDQQDWPPTRVVERKVAEEYVELDPAAAA